MRQRALVAIIAVAGGGVASAHKPSDAHLQIAVNGDQLTGTLAVALRDLDGALDLDADGNGEITWTETLAAAPRITAYAQDRLTIASCRIAFGAGKLVDFSDGAYWTMPLTGACRSTTSLVVTYALLYDIDAQHRGIVQIQTGQGTHTIVVRNAKPLVVELAPTSAIGAGVRAVWAHPAHLVLLACLILPAVLVRRGRRWHAQVSSRTAARTMATVTGMFALACGSMLLVSAARLIYLPDQVVDAGLAASIGVAAAMNLLSVVDARRDFAFELGLLQGLGCALWLRDSGLADHQLGPALGFAAGVALAQAMFVTAVAAPLLLVRRTFAYRVVLWGGSGATLVTAAIWLGLPSLS